MPLTYGRRGFAVTLSAAGAAALLGCRGALADEGPPETTTVRLRRDPTICSAPWYVAEELLRAAGFTDVRYVPVSAGPPIAQAVARGEIDFGPISAAHVVMRLDDGLPITALAGVHAGCYELFAHEPVRSITDLKGKSVDVNALGSGKHVYAALMVAYVGLDPQKDIEWVVGSSADPLEPFADGKVDAFLGWPPEPQELRARKIGRLILSTTTDKPWSQYFCCMLIGNREFVRFHPVATKRVLRAIIKADEICAARPEAAARRLVDDGITERYDDALQTVTELPYASWRELDAEDSLRFFALRLKEVGMIKADPKALIAEGADWRFLNEIKRELKA